MSNTTRRRQRVRVGTAASLLSSAAGLSLLAAGTVEAGNYFTHFRDNTNPNVSCTGSSLISSAPLQTYAGFSSGQTQLRFQSSCGTSWSRTQTYLNCVPADYGCTYSKVTRLFRLANGNWTLDAEYGTWVQSPAGSNTWGWSAQVRNQSAGSVRPPTAYPTGNFLQSKACGTVEGPENCTTYY